MDELEARIMDYLDERVMEHHTRAEVIAALENIVATLRIQQQDDPEET